MPLRPDMDIRDYLEVLLRRKWIIVVSFVAVFFGAGAYLLVNKPLYMSTTTILVIPQQNTIRPNGYWMDEDRLSTIEQQVTSRTWILNVAEKLGFLAGAGETQDRESLYVKMKDRIGISVLEDIAGRGGRVSKEGFSLSYVDEDPNLAMRGASTLASLFIDKSMEAREQQVVRTSNLLESQLKDIEEKLVSQEEKIKRYKMQHLGELPQELNTMLSNLNRLQDQYRSNSAGIQSGEQRKFFLQSQMSMVERGPQTIVQKDGREELDTSGESAQALIKELTDRRNQLAELTAKYTDHHPDVIRKKQEVDELEKKVSLLYMRPRELNQGEKDGSNNNAYLPLAGWEREKILGLRAQVASTEAEIDGLKKDNEIIKEKIADLQAKVNRIPRHEQDLVALSRDYDNLKTLYDDLHRKKMEANISEDKDGRQKGEQFLILDPANLPEKPFKPNKRKILLLALLLASGLGFGGAIVLEGGDQTLRGTKDFQHFFNQKIFACVPDIDDEAQARRKTWQMGAALGGLLLVVALVLVLLWFYEDKILTLIKI